MQFCQLLGCPPVPLSPVTVCRYAAYLARRLRFSSIRQYLNIIRLLHLEAGLPNPLLDNWTLTSLLKGMRRSLGDSVSRKLPITPQILLHIRSTLSPDSPLHCVFWAACLVAFFGLLRKASLLPPSASAFSPLRHLVKGDFRVFPWGLGVVVRHTKTIQVQQRQLLIPLPALQGHPLCPTSAIITALALTPSLPVDSPAFVYQDHRGTHVLSGSTFTNLLRKALAMLSLPSQHFSGHSFRRGGASWAFQQGVSAESIRMMGDWRSDAFLAYLSPSPTSLSTFSTSFSANLPSTI